MIWTYVGVDAAHSLARKHITARNLKKEVTPLVSGKPEAATLVGTCARWAFYLTFTNTE